MVAAYKLSIDPFQELGSPSSCRSSPQQQAQRRQIMRQPGSVISFDPFFPYKSALEPLSVSD
jgi:hypothetical protein